MGGCAESSAQSYGEEGEEGTLEGTTGLDLGSARGSEEVPSGRGRLPSRRGAELGKRERRKRRMDDADEDDLNSLDEPPEGTKKRRRAGAPHAYWREQVVLRVAHILGAS